MNGNLASSPIKNNFLPIVDLPLFRALVSISHKYCVSMDLVHTCPRWHRFLAYTATGEVDSAFHAIWLVAQLRISLHYSPPDKNQMAFHFVPVYTDYYESWNTDYFKTIFRIFVVFWSFLFWCGIC
jgi:hypothetical protein